MTLLQSDKSKRSLHEMLISQVGCCGASHARGYLRAFKNLCLSLLSDRHMPV